jgi:hypothetical protein
MSHKLRVKGLKLDAREKSQKTALFVIPAKAGIQSFQPLLDPGFRRGDGVENQILLK